MNKRTIPYVLVVGLAAASAVGAYGAHAASTPSISRGAGAVYRGIAADQVEQITTPDRIKSVAMSAAKQSAPAAIWQALEHGEKVDCLDCIPAVEKLLYASDAKTREISAWWLRRRIFGVFGPGQTYERTIQTLQTHADEKSRAQAAEALGEFLWSSGVAPVATALVKDSSPMVRAAAARALNRLNSTGPNNELSQALSDGDQTVRLGALTAAVRIRGFADVAAVTKLLSDPSIPVRQHAASALGSMRAKDAVAALIGLISAAQESDPVTRAEAAHSLGLIGDIAAKNALLAAEGDADPRVRDAATIALRSLG